MSGGSVLLEPGPGRHPPASEGPGEAAGGQRSVRYTRAPCPSLARQRCWSSCVVALIVLGPDKLPGGQADRGPVGRLPPIPPAARVRCARVRSPIYPPPTRSPRPCGRPLTSSTSWPIDRLDGERGASGTASVTIDGADAREETDGETQSPAGLEPTCGVGAGLRRRPSRSQYLVGVSHQVRAAGGVVPDDPGHELTRPGPRWTGRGSPVMAISLKRRNEARPPPDSMTLVEHLGELRRRVVISRGGLRAWPPPWPSCSTTASCPSSSTPTARSSRPLQLVRTGPLDGLSLRIKIAAYGGLFLASPIILWELWRFITPGLHPKEKQYAIPFIVSSILLFALGCLVAYYTFPHALQFLDHIGGPSLQQISTPTVPQPHPLADDGLRADLRVPGPAGLAADGRGAQPPDSSARGDVGHRRSSWWSPGWSPRAPIRSR